MVKYIVWLYIAKSFRISDFYKYKAQNILLIRYYLV